MARLHPCRPPWPRRAPGRSGSACAAALPARAGLALAVALAGLWAASADASAQQRPSSVRISRGHVYVDGRHVGAVRSFRDRGALARIVNPWVRPSPPLAHRPPDARAGSGTRRHDAFGPGGPGVHRGFPAGVVGRPGRDPFGLRHRFRPRVGANGILLGGPLPAGRFRGRLPGTAFLGGRLPFCFPHPLLPLAWVSVSVRTDGTVAAGRPAPGAAPGRAAPTGDAGAAGGLAFDVGELDPEAAPGAGGPTGAGRAEAAAGPCVAVTVQMTAGARQWLRVPLRTLGADSAAEADAILRDRLRSGRPLRLHGVGGGLIVPAGLVEDVAVEACPAG